MKPETQKEIGKYFVDVSKLFLGGIVLATVLKIETVEKIWLVMFGLTVTAIFALTGFIIINKNQKTE
jgi:hypothetical protein